ncbi:MAG TPA: Na+/H+ antiporter subunit E [Pseudonocardiaceae bacterium]|jgi:multisubunit Na+/H+ antiporter MnhE subunit|nr:Na+/H+ antiporter subunit E [Pseudonocardiaceae bacterium]
MAVEIAGWWAFLVVVWIATLNTLSTQEVVTAAVLAVPCAIAARAARRAAELRWTIAPRWGRWVLALPPAIAHDTVAVLRLAMRRRTSESDDEFRVLKLPAERDDGRRTGREAVTTAVLSATPGSVVVNAGDDHDELLVHAMPVGRTRLERELRR